MSGEANGDGSHMNAARGITRWVLVAATAFAVSACVDRPLRGDSPGTNERVGDLQIRNAHVDERPAGEPYPPGADIPMHVWFYNEGTPIVLVEVTSPVAADVSLTGTELPVTLPTEVLVALGPRDDKHFVLEDVKREIAGHEFIPVHLVFDSGQTVELDVEPVDVKVAQPSEFGPHG